MALSLDQKPLPPYAYLDERNVERYRQSTLRGTYGLLPPEIFWRDRQRFLLEAGYVLRPRYCPDWEPSWLGTNRHPVYCEDSVLQVDYQIIDAKRSRDDELVAIKTVSKGSQELQVAQYLSTIQDPHNRTVPVLEVFDDPYDSQLSLMVTPYLRPCNDPEFSMVGDVVDFVNETLEGLAFMHRHNVVHRDIAVENIMMDAKALFPDGHHPVRLNYTPDALYPVRPLSREDRDVHYFYIDFGLACQIPPGSSPLMVGDVGRDTEVPELSSTVPYDTFKVDVFALGNLYQRDLVEKYTNLQFLLPLIESMKQRQPQLRPTTEEALAQWQGIRDALNETTYRWRIASKAQPALGRLINDTVAVAWESINNLKKLVIY